MTPEPHGGRRPARLERLRLPAPAVLGVLGAPDTIVAAPSGLRPGLDRAMAECGHASGPGAALVRRPAAARVRRLAAAPGRPRPRSAPVAALVVALLTAALAGCTTPPPGARMPSPVWVESVTQPPLGVRDTAYDPPRPAPALRLTDQDGAPFDLMSLRGRAVFVYFGYTHCPDVCPTTLADLRAGIAAAGTEATVVFVTVDPARDDAAAMKQYVDAYRSGYTGLTGDAASIATAAAAWGVTYRRLPSASAGGYAMAHSTDAYLVDASGMLRYHLFFGAGTDLIADALRDVAAR